MGGFRRLSNNRRCRISIITGRRRESCGTKRILGYLDRVAINSLWSSVVKYKILSFAAPHVVVEYSTDDDQHKALLNVRIDKKLDGTLPQGAELDEYIMSFCPQLPPVDPYDGVDWSGISALVPPTPIAEARSRAELAIDSAASSARGRFISSGVGQDAVYVVKGQQAEAFAASGFNGDPPAYIAAEAAATGVTPMVAAQTILGLRDAWNNLIGPAIESQRIGGKKLVREATTVEEVDARMRAATLALEEIRP